MSTINLKSNYQYVGFAKKEMYITSPVRYSTISSEELINYACENSGIPKAQMASAFYALNQQIEQFIMNGHSLTLGNLGILYLSAKTKAADTEDTAGSGSVESFSIKFRQSKRLRNLLDTNISLKTTMNTAQNFNPSDEEDDDVYEEEGSGDIAGGGETNENPLMLNERG